METLITSVVSILATSGVLGIVLFYRENKRAKALENEKSLNDEWLRLYNRVDERNEQLSTRVTTCEEHITQLNHKVAELTLEKVKLIGLSCEVKGCPNRQPTCVVVA